MSVQVDGATQKDPAPIPFVVDGNELTCLDGVTSNIQTQLDGKAASSHTHAASAITSGQLAQARGGTGADLSATGGTSQVLKQVSAGAAITVAQLTLADLAAGTLPVALTLSSSLTVTAANRELIGTSSGVQRNTPTGTTIIDSVNGTAIQTLSSTIDTHAVPIKWSTNVALTSTDYAIGKHSTTQLGIGVPTSSFIGLMVNNSTHLWAGANVSGAVAAGNWGAGLAAGNYISNTAGTALALQVLTANTITATVASTRLLTLGGGLNGTGDERFGLGAYGFLGSASSGAKSGIGSTGATSMEYNVNTGGLHNFLIAGTTTLLSLGAGINTVANKAWGIGAFGRLGPAASAGEAGIGYAGSGAIYTNVPTGGTQIKSFQGTTAYTFAAASLTFADAINLIVGSTSGTKIGTATTQKLGFWNATPVVQQVLATGTGATVDNVISLLQTLGLCKQS